MKFLYILDHGSGGEVIERHFLSGASADPLFSGVEPFVQNW